jgi:hypothetical protein
MLTTTNVVLKTQPIKDVRQTPEAVSITLCDGSIARLGRNHSHFDVLMIYIESDLRRTRPVGLALDSSGNVIDSGAAHDTAVRSVRP